MTEDLKLSVKNLDSELTVNRLITEPGNLEILCGTTSPVVITAEYLDGHTENVTNLATIFNPLPQIATISNGVVTALSKGAVTISADFRGKIGVSKSGTIAVNVYNRSPYVKNEVEDYNDQSGIQSEDCNDIDGGKNIGYIENGDWVRINALDFDKGISKFEARVSSASSGGYIEIRLNSPSGTLIGKCPVTNTGGWQTWVTKTCVIENIKGIYDIYLVFTGGGGYLFNMNWWKFYATSASVIDSKSELTPAIVSKNGQNYIVNIFPDDVVILYNSLGQEIESFKATSTEESLSGNFGAVIIQIRRGLKLYSLKTVLKRA
ncbi:MAG: carbohydrate-binding protein [Bacteroidota bacterium]|nr:carbohydrate-binding protein [Bacteroidota bacterium]